MEDLTKGSIDNFLDAVAQRTPTPGGGSVAAATGASACALARMVAEYSIGRNSRPDDRTRMEALLNRLRGADEILRGLVTQDALAYEAMSAAAKAAPERLIAKPAHQKAVLAAVAVPMESAASASHALAAMDQLKDFANRRLLSDLGVAAVVGEAAARAAWYMAAVNLPELTDAEMRTKLRANMDETVRHCEDHRRSIEAFVRSHLQSS